MRNLVSVAASVALACALAACGSEPEAPVDVSPEAPEGIAIGNGRLNLPAVAGNPAAVYFTITNNGSEDQLLRAINVPGAENAMFHETAEWEGRMDMQELLQVNIPAGESVTFEPGGKHVMVFDLTDGLEAGDEIEATLSFVRGDKVSFPLRLLAPGDDGSSMEMGE
jgi:copper(I)-binding protein